eukprot:comp23948_c0_seq1/m.42362 comp23948_c0_seq1/g.42362  ORF comp23948_c0_seq1/g.42362 comp23948_c0_seq1/m.42362 type:complete len:605 (-) comp23948_c0_seq1:425-2239(-)
MGAGCCGGGSTQPKVHIPAEEMGAEPVPIVRNKTFILAVLAAALSAAVMLKPAYGAAVVCTSVVVLAILYVLSGKKESHRFRFRPTSVVVDPVTGTSAVWRLLKEDSLLQVLQFKLDTVEQPSPAELTKQLAVFTELRALLTTVPLIPMFKEHMDIVHIALVGLTCADEVTETEVRYRSAFLSNVFIPLCAHADIRQRFTEEKAVRTIVETTKKLIEFAKAQKQPKKNELLEAIGEAWAEFMFIFKEDSEREEFLYGFNWDFVFLLDLACILLAAPGAHGKYFAALLFCIVSESATKLPLTKQNDSSIELVCKDFMRAGGFTSLRTVLTLKASQYEMTTTRMTVSCTLPSHLFLSTPTAATNEVISSYVSAGLASTAVEFLDSEKGTHEEAQEVLFAVMKQNENWGGVMAAGAVPKLVDVLTGAYLSVPVLQHCCGILACLATSKDNSSRDLAQMAQVLKPLRAYKVLTAVTNHLSSGCGGKQVKQNIEDAVASAMTTLTVLVADTQYAQQCFQAGLYQTVADIHSQGLERDSTKVSLFHVFAAIVAAGKGSKPMMSTEVRAVIDAVSAFAKNTKYDPSFTKQAAVVFDKLAACGLTKQANGHA